MLKIFAPLVRADHVKWMRLQTAESVKERVLRLLISLMALCAIHACAMMYFEQLHLADAVWVTLTTVTTVGYGDFSATTAGGRISTIILLYIAGISLLAQVASEFLEYRIERRNRMILGQWRWKGMKDHILIINAPGEDSSLYLTRLVKQIRKTPELADVPVQILAPQFENGLPIELRELGVVHRCAVPDAHGELQLCNVNSAKYVLLLAPDRYDQHADAITLNLLIHLKDSGVTTPILAEAVLDENRERFMRFGAFTVLRPIRAYPEILVRALVAPGSEVIMEDLFSYGGVHPTRVEVELQGQWGDIATKLIMSNFGVPLGYVSASDRVESSPDVEHSVDAKALLLMVTSDHDVTSAKVRALFANQQ